MGTESARNVISVIIPTYNRLWALRRSLSPFYGNPLVGEIVVVNDASTDGTREWLDREAAQHPILRPIHHAENRGATGSRNTGIDEARCEYVFFWDDDMLVMPSNGLQILFAELLRLQGDVIGPCACFREGTSPCGIPLYENAPTRLTRNDAMVLRRTIMVRNLPAKEVPRETFQTPLLYGLMLVRRAVLDNTRYSDDFAPTYYRDETDVQLALQGKGCKLLACPYVYAIDLQRPPSLGNDGGCHAHTRLFSYNFVACRNNWRMLKRRKDVIHKVFGHRMPILFLQMFFICDRVVAVCREIRASVRHQVALLIRYHEWHRPNPR